MDYGDYCWGLYRDYYRDPFPHTQHQTVLGSLGSKKPTSPWPGYAQPGRGIATALQAF